MEIVFAAVLGIIALWAAWQGVQVRRTSSRVAAGYGAIAVSAVLQILNLMGTLAGEYSVAFSVITTVGLLAGLALTRQPGARV